MFTERGMPGGCFTLLVIVAAALFMLGGLVWGLLGMLWSFFAWLWGWPLVILLAVAAGAVTVAGRRRSMRVKAADGPSSLQRSPE